jgi:hypothetical protein
VERRLCIQGVGGSKPLGARPHKRRDSGTRQPRSASTNDDLDHKGKVVGHHEYAAMGLDKGMAETVAQEAPTAAEVAACSWLTDADPTLRDPESARICRELVHRDRAVAEQVAHEVQGLQQLVLC